MGKRDAKPDKAVDNVKLADEIRAAIASVDLVGKKLRGVSAPPMLVQRLGEAAEALYRTITELENMYDH